MFLIMFFIVIPNPWYYYLICIHYLPIWRHWCTKNSRPQHCLSCFLLHLRIRSWWLRVRCLEWVAVRVTRSLGCRTKLQSSRQRWGGVQLLPWDCGITRFGGAMMEACFEIKTLHCGSRKSVLIHCQITVPIINMAWKYEVVLFFYWSDLMSMIWAIEISILHSYFAHVSMGSASLMELFKDITYMIMD